MIKSSQLIPEIYNTSYDFTIFEGLIDLVFNSIEYKSNAILGLHSPIDCFEENLKKLANCVGIEFSTDRQLIKQMMLMRKSKGTTDVYLGILRACGAQGEIKISLTPTHTVSFFCESFNMPLYKELVRKLCSYWLDFQFDFVVPNSLSDT